jgi:hypothetical protein
MAITVGNVLDSVAALINDPNKITYTYAKMLPYFYIVYETAQNELTLAGHPALSEVSGVNLIPAGTREVDFIEVDTLPRDMVDVVVSAIRVYERAVGDNEDAWSPMERLEWDDLREFGSELGSWTWREGIMYVTPATVDREVKVLFRRTFREIVNEATQIEHPNFAAYLRHAVAGYIAAFVMKDMTRAAALDRLAEKSMEVAKSTAVKDMQFLPKRRRRYFFRR